MGNDLSGSFLRRGTITTEGDDIHRLKVGVSGLPPKSGGTFWHSLLCQPILSFKFLRTIISQGRMKPLAIVESLDIGKEAPFGFLPSGITFFPDTLSF